MSPRQTSPAGRLWRAGAIVAFGAIAACGQFQKQADAKFGDQNFKTAIALIELHKVRFGEYPGSLKDLRFVGDWDGIALSAVKYERVDSGYSWTSPEAGSANRPSTIRATSGMGLAFGGQTWIQTSG